MMNITYVLDGALYLNITNKCPCACTFCIRKNGEGAYGSDCLWLEHQPSEAEVLEALSKEDFDSYKEVVFCGFGEPTSELEILKSAARYIRQKSSVKIRINTNGLSDLINGRETAKELKGLFDVVSISLNAPTKDEYNAVTNPKWKDKAFDAMLKFAKESKEIFPKVMLTVVDVISEDEIKRSRELCEKLGIELRVREYAD